MFFLREVNGGLINNKMSLEDCHPDPHVNEHINSPNVNSYDFKWEIDQLTIFL